MLDYIKTPLLFSEPLSVIAGCEIYLKLENLQPSGSFKNRCMSHLCRGLAKEGAKGFVIASGGNAGYAAAYASRQLGLPIHVVVPETTLPIMQKKIESTGAEYIVHGKQWIDAKRYAEELAVSLGFPILSPFDHPLIWEGNSTIVDEIMDEGIDPDGIILSVGGGGLYTGIAQGLKRHSRENTAIITSETEGASSFAQSVQAGRLVTLKSVHTIATSLVAPRVAEEAFKMSSQHSTYPEVVSDKEAADASYEFCLDHRLLVEPSCGASLALIYQKRKVLNQFKRLVVIVCGGCVITPEILIKYHSPNQQASVG